MVKKKGDVLAPLLFNFVLEYAIKRVKENQDGLKLSSKYHLLVYADGVSILGVGVSSMEKNMDTLVVANKETGLEVNADKTKYMVMSRY